MTRFVKKGKPHLAYVPCRGGCGKTLATATRLGSAEMRQKFAGWCQDCMTPEMREEMTKMSLENMRSKA